MHLKCPILYVTNNPSCQNRNKNHKQVFSSSASAPYWCQVSYILHSEHRTFTTLEGWKLLKIPVRISSECLVCKVRVVRARNEHERPKEYEGPEPLIVLHRVNMASHDKTPHYQEGTPHYEEYQSIDDCFPRNLGWRPLKLFGQKLLMVLRQLVSLICVRISLVQLAVPNFTHNSKGKGQHFVICNTW